MTERPVKCGQCRADAGTFENPVTPCSSCGAELITIMGAWYWKRKPRTGIEKEFHKDENGRKIDLYGETE